MYLNTHKIHSFVVAVFICLFSLQNCFGNDVITQSYSFSYKGERTTFLENYTFPQVKGLSSHGEVGSPDLPVKRVSLLVPQGFEFAGVSAVGNPQKIQLSKPIVPAQQAVAISADIQQRTIDRNGSIYSSDELYPERLIQQPKEFFFRGYRIVTALLYPVQYRPLTNELYFYDTLDVTVQLRKSRQPENELYRGLEKDQQIVTTLVDNPEITQTYGAVYHKRGSIDGIIITNMSMKSAYEDLAASKKQRGMNLDVVLMSDILSQTSGTDKADKVRNYIRKTYIEQGIEYAILGGDVSVVPHRILYNNSQMDDYMKQFPCDIYFGGLDGNWDADNNGYYGEFHKDSSDYFAEVFVGRLSTETLAEASAVVHKIKKFESTSRPELVFLQSSMMDDTNSSRDVKEGNEYTDSVGCHYYVPDHYTVNTLYQEDGKNSNKSYIDGWNSGPLMLNHCGHGLERSYSIARRGDHFGNADAEALVNDVYPIHASISCLTGSFDWETDDCIAEKLLLNPNGGVVSTVQNSRNGLYSYGNALKHSGELDIELYKQIFKKQVPTLGQAVQFARQEFANLAWYTSSYNQVVYVWNLLGDPTLQVLEERSPLDIRFSYPANEDTLPINKEVSIGWNCTGENSTDWKIDISYSMKGPLGPWKSISKNLTNAGSALWNTPDSVGDKCYLLLEAKVNDTLITKKISKRLSLQSGISTISHTQALENMLYLYSSPNTITGHLKMGQMSGELTLLDVRGRVLQKKPILQNQETVFNALQSGVYFVSLLVDKKSIFKRVVVP